MHEINLQSKSKTDFIDITPKVQDIITKTEIIKGTCLIFVPHTTAAVTINENADPDVFSDIKSALGKIVPWKNMNFRHIEGNSHAHVKASLFGSSEILIIDNMGLLLGTWQGIFFCEFDGPRERKVYVQIF